MGLLSILRKNRQKERQIRVLLLGLDNAGKTSILKRLQGQDISEVSPTLGFNIQTVEAGGFKLNMWDIGGQRSLRSYWRNYFEHTDAIVWVVDSAADARLDECAAELREVLKEERLLGASLLVLANKADLLPPYQPHQPRLTEQLAARLQLTQPAIASAHHVHVVPCSALTGAGLEPAFRWLLADINARLYSA